MVRFKEMAFTVCVELRDRLCQLWVVPGIACTDTVQFYIFSASLSVPQKNKEIKSYKKKHKDLFNKVLISSS